MNWAAGIFFLAAGVALIFWREPLAHWQGMIMGARLRPGCVLGQAALLLLIAILVFFLRPYS